MFVAHQLCTCSSVKYLMCAILMLVLLSPILKMRKLRCEINDWLEQDPRVVSRTLAFKTNNVSLQIKLATTSIHVSMVLGK